MNTFKLRSLAQEIVKKGNVRKSHAKKIESLLTSSELSKLSEYISVEQDKKTVRITVAEAPTKKTVGSVSRMFGGKRVISTIDSSIGAGVKAQVYDMIYDLTIKTKLNNMVARLEEEL